MFEKITPEQAGVKSESLIKFIKTLEDNDLNTHSILFMKGDKIFFEAYYKPFHQDYLHRMYSETKSFVSIAIGLLLEEGKLNLDDPIIKYFPEYIDFKPHPYLRKQTIKDMLMMRTCIDLPLGWFYQEENDRVSLYFHTKPCRPSGMYFKYDSDGSQVLSTLVEKLSGMKLLDYLKYKLFNKMGTFKTAYTLDTPTGTTWGDSSLICTLRDIASFGRLVMNYGVYNGERLMDSEYLFTATSKLVDNKETVYQTIASFGYGYQIWHLEGNAFAFFGMGDQLVFMFPDQDVLFAINSSNQGNQNSRYTIYKAVKEIIVSMSNSSIEENRIANVDLEQMTCDLKLRCLPEGITSSLEKDISGITYVCEKNQMGIKEFKLNLTALNGSFEYVNEQGKKVINFGRGFNIFETFPQEGYSNMIGKIKSENYFYKCANSGCWLDNEKFLIEVEVIDKYFGNLSIFISFKDNVASLFMKKNAENFFREYFGEAFAKQKR